MLTSGAVVILGILLLTAAGAGIILAAFASGRRNDCPRCSNANVAAARFCARCGTPLHPPGGSAPPPE